MKKSWQWVPTCKIVVKWVTVIDVLNLNSIIYYCVHKKRLETDMIYPLIIHFMIYTLK